MASEPWRVSLHGGHSGEFCEHAADRLRDVLEAAVAAGYHTFGVSEHAPRSEERFLYPTERQKGFTAARLQQDFENYAREVRRLSKEFADRLVVLCGFEAEVVPSASYRQEMLAHRQGFDFDYMVGSVHYVQEISIDGVQEDFEQALAETGGLEKLTVLYYESVSEMIEALRPDVVGHFDLIRKNAGPEAPLDTPAIRRAADQALEAARELRCILDLNTAGYRKGLGTPYPAPWLVKRAAAMGVGFCFGDDSHAVSQVGEDIERARKYLLAQGVAEVTVLTREDGEIVRKAVPL